MGTGAGSVSLSQFPPTDSKKGGLGSTSTRQTPHLPAPFLQRSHTGEYWISLYFVSLSRLFWHRKKKYHREEAAREGKWSRTAGGRASGWGGAEHRGQAEPPAQDFCFSKVGRERGTDIGHAEREGARWVGLVDCYSLEG